MSELGDLTLSLRVNAQTMFADLRKATQGVQNELEKTNRRAAKGMESTMREMQGYIDRITGRKATNELNLLGQAIQGVGGKSRLNAQQLERLTAEVNRLAVAGGKVPASLQGLTGVGSKLTSVFQALGTGGGISGALAAIGPAGLAASAGLGVVTLAGTKAFTAIKDLASEAEQWTNLAKSTGLGVVEVQQLSTLLEDAGIPAEAMKIAFKELQKEIASGGKELAKFGIDVAALKNLSPEEQFRTMAAQIAAIEDPADRTAVALAAFGRSGQELIPVLDDVASSSDKMLEALSESQVKALNEADAKIDAAARKWEFLKKTFLATAIEFASFTPTQGTVSIFGGGKKPETGGGGGEGGLAWWAEVERQMTVERNAAAEATKKATDESKKGTAEAKRALDERLRAIQKQNQAAVDLIKAREDETKAIQRTQQALIEQAFAAEDRSGIMAPGGLGSIAQADQAIFEQAKRNAEEMFATLVRGGMSAADATARVSTRLEGMSLSAHDASTILDGLTPAFTNAGQGTDTWTSRLGTLAQQLQVLASTTGGLTGKILNFAATLSSGLGGVLSGLGAFKSAGGGLLGFLGKASGALGIIGSAVGVVGGIIGGIKSLFGGKSKEEKAAEAAALKQAQADALQALIDARRKVESGLSTARGGAESLMARLDAGGLSEGLRQSFQTLISKVGDALLKTGLGILDSRLAQSEAFVQAQAMAVDVAAVIQGMREAGFIDATLMEAAGASAAEIQREAIQAARQAGLSDMEAARAGSAAIAALLREQLNASIQSGEELDENTRRLLEEARANGIEILADPAIQSLAVQRQQLGVLQRIAGMPVTVNVTVGGGSSSSGGSSSGGGSSGGGTGPGNGDGGGPDIPQMSRGGFINAPRSGALAMLHGPELVVPMDLARMHGSAGSQNRGVSGSDSAALLTELRLLRSDYAEMPRRMANAVRVAMSLSS